MACGGMMACGRMMACSRMMTWSNVNINLWPDGDDADDTIIFRVTQENEVLRHKRQCKDGNRKEKWKGNEEERKREVTRRNQVSLLRFSVMQRDAVCTVLHN